MRVFKPVFGLLFLLAGALPTAAQSAMLDNGDFERAGDSADHIPGWGDYVWDGDGHVKHSGTTRFAGERAALIQGSGPGKIAIFQEVKDADACSYHLTAKIAGAEITPGTYDKGAVVYVEIPGRNPVLSDLFSTDTDWREMDLTFNVPSKGAFTVYFFNYGSGLFFVDDVKLEPIAGCSQAADEQAVLSEVVQKLAYSPPVDANDLVLAGYCKDSEFSTREVCKRIAGADLESLKDKPATADLTLSDFDAVQPFYTGSASRTAGDWSLIPTKDGHGKAALLTPGSYLVGNPETGLAGDWQGYGWLRIEASNASSKPQPLYIEIHDDKSNNYWSRVNWYTMVPPGQSQVQVPLQNFVGEKLVIHEPRRLDLAHIMRLVISAAGADSDLVIDNVRLAPQPGFKSDFPHLIKLDAGSPTSPLMPGFNQLTPTALYRPYRGYGLSQDARIGRVEDRRHPDNLLRDWISFRTGGLDFDLPNGTYHVWMMLEDPGYWEYYPNFQHRAVYAEGQRVLDELPSFEQFMAKFYRHADDEDVPGDDIWSRYIPPRYKPLEFDVSVADGQLNIRFDSGADPFAVPLSALIIYPVAEKDKGEAFIAELWHRLKELYDAEYLQVAPAATPGDGSPPNALDGKLTVFHRPAWQDVQANDKPQKAELASSLSASLALGEYEPLTVSLLPNVNLPLTGATLDLPGLTVTPYRVRYKLTRATADGTVYWNIPRILDPLVASDEAPMTLKAHQVRSLWFDIYAPPDARPGPVTGTLKLSFGNETLDLPVTVTVHPWTLPQADADIGYLGVATLYPQTKYAGITIKRDKELATGLDLLHRYGFTAFSGGIGGPEFKGYEMGRLRMNFLPAQKTMVALKKVANREVNTYGGLEIAGLPQAESPEASTEYNRSYQTVVKEVLAAIEGWSSANQWLPMMHSLGDEPDEGQLPSVIARAKAFKAAGSDVRTSVFTSLSDPAKDPRKDLAGLLSRLYVNVHSEAALRYILDKGSECALYNQNDRYRLGLYLFKMRAFGCKGHLKFAYHSVHVDHYYALDGREEDYTAVFEDRAGNLHPTLDLVRYREAVDDFRYLQKLEQSIRDAPAGAAKDGAKRWLDALMSKMEIGSDKKVPWSAGEIDGIRQQAAEQIDKLVAPVQN